KSGQPLANVPLAVQVCTADEGNGRGCSTPQTRSDAAGRFKIEKLRPDVTLSLPTVFPGYKYVGGGKITYTGRAFVADELVLIPLSSQVEGRVLDAHGTPIAGAVVLSPDGDIGAQAVTDANGHFVLKSLPEDEATILAAYGSDLAEVHHAKGQPQGQQTVQLRLSPLKAASGQDPQRAYALLKLLWEVGPRGLHVHDPDTYALLKDLWAMQNRYDRYSVLHALVPYDPDIALKLVQESDGAAFDSMLVNLITQVTFNDPARAARWAPDKLRLIRDAEDSFYPRLALAQAIVDVKPDLARELYQQLREQYAERAAKIDGNNLPDAYALSTLASLALRLRLTEAQELTEQAMAAVKKSDQSMEFVVGPLIAARPELAQKLVANLPERERTMAMLHAIPRLARYNVAAAQRLLNSVEKTQVNKYTYYYFDAALRLIKRVGPNDPAAALALARKVAAYDQRAQALLLAAQFQPKDARLPILREAELSLSNRSYEETALRVMAMMYEIDPKLGAERFAERKAEILQAKAIASRNPRRNPYQPEPSGLGTFAYYYSRVAPAESRVLLEQEFAQLRRRLPQPNADLAIYTLGFGYAGSVYQSLANCAVAMAAIDLDRALEMASALASEGSRERRGFSNVQLDALRQIAEYMLAPDAARRGRPFKQWGRAEY
ncbi:MAG: carboxypeptidase-like regulatory domain-containing protein, partial [Armatimonadota bacterium]|nr:carboxypeptidase-like regulatory domain-containing protein [Armatimonadota bacterium]